MLITLCQQDPYTQQPPQTLPYALRLDELIISLNQHFSQRFGARHQHTALVEEPAIVQDAIIRHTVDPFPLRLSRRIPKDTREMSQDRMAALHASVQTRKIFHSRNFSNVQMAEEYVSVG